MTGIEMRTMETLCRSLPRIADALEQIAETLARIEARKEGSTKAPGEEEGPTD